jgi:hypothetical protein
MLLAEDEVYMYNGAAIVTIKAAGSGVLKLHQQEQEYRNYTLLHYYYTPVPVHTPTTKHHTSTHTGTGISTWQLSFGGRQVLTTYYGAYEGQVFI